MAGVQRAACRMSSMKSIIHQVCLQKLILSLKNLWSPYSSIFFLLLPGITRCGFFFSQCWFFTLWFRVRSPDRIRLCLAVAKKPLKKNQGISCALGECGEVHCCHLHQRSLIISSTISICLQYFKWVAQLKPLLKFKHMHKFSWAGSRKGPHRNRLQQVYSTISVELLEGGTVLTWFLWLLMIYLGFYVNKVSLLAYYNHHNESSKLSWP